MDTLGSFFLRNSLILTGSFCRFINGFYSFFNSHFFGSGFLILCMDAKTYTGKQCQYGK